MIVSKIARCGEPLHMLFDADRLHFDQRSLLRRPGHDGRNGRGLETSASEKGLRASNAVFRRNSQRDPWKPPDLPQSNLTHVFLRDKDVSPWAFYEHTMP